MTQDIRANSAEVPRTPTPTSPQALDRALGRGVAWMGMVKWGAQGLAWCSTIVVARLLSPADYGLVGLATTYLGFVMLLSEFGIGPTIVALRNLGRNELAQLNTLAVLFGAAGFLVSLAAAPLLAKFFNEPQLTRVIIALATVFLITGAKVAPLAVLQRELRFRQIAMNDAAQAVVLSVGAVVFAFMGFAYWTLVISAVLGALISTALAVRLVRIPFRWPDFSAIRPAMRFSGETIIARMSWYLYQNADFLVAGKVFGRDQLGQYRFGWDLSTAPVEKTTSMVASVTPSIFSAAQKDLPALRRYLLGVSEGLALVAFPAMLGLAMVADDVVHVSVGAKWQDMVSPLRFLCISAAMRAVAAILPQVLAVTGENRTIMRVNLLGVVVLPIAFVIGSRWGLAGIAACWILIAPITQERRMAEAVFRKLEMGWSAYFRALWAPLSSALVMCLGLLALRQAQPADMLRGLRLAIEVASGALLYGLALLIFHRERVRTVVRTVRSIRGNS